MSKKRRQYTREFKLEALRLWKTSGKSAAQIEQDLGLTQGRLYRWQRDLKQAGEDAFPGQGRQAGLEEEVRCKWRLFVDGRQLIHHSDRGSQYTSQAYQSLLARYQMRPNMSKTGSCFDNAVAESFFSTLKCEWLHRQRFATRQATLTAIFYFIEVFYNRRRLHSTLNYVSPLAF